MEIQQKELDDFQIRNIMILTHLLANDAISDEIIELLRKSELDYFTLTDKYKLLEQKINIDDKTNLLKFKKSYLTDILKTASRVYYGQDSIKYSISLVRIDIDDFSIFNSEFGHDIGDEVLVTIANILKNCSRPTDYVIRFGGEEFDIILPSTDIDGAQIFLKKIFYNLNNSIIKHNGEQLKVTVSAGVSHFNYYFRESKILDDSEIEKKFKKLQQEADNALYEAKYLGKNQYSIYTEEKKEEYVKIRKLYAK